MECVPNWITIQLSLFTPSLFLYPLLFFFFCHSCPFIASFSKSPSLHLMAYTCQPSGHGTAVTKWNAPVFWPVLFPPRVRSQCSAYSTQPQHSCPNYTIRTPIHLSLSQLFFYLPFYQREEIKHFRFLTCLLPSGADIVHMTDFKIEPATKAIIASSKKEVSPVSLGL